MNRIKAGKAVLNMALDAIGGADDVARAAGKAVKAPKAAAAKALDAIADTADDWGWKGGKPGEITGSIYKNRPDVMVRDDRGNLVHTKTLAMSQLKDAVAAGKLPKEAATEAGMRTWMRRFFEAEDADIPREWTGPAVRAYSALSPFRQRTLFSSFNASPNPAMVQISETLRPMTGGQRETFLALLPEWDGTLDDLTEAAKALG